MTYPSGVTLMTKQAIVFQAMNLIDDNKDQFREEFKQWFLDNYHVFDAFRESADKVWAEGFTHYSARTIMEVIRHRSNIRELHGEYKINNNYTPDCARLYGLLYPHRACLFSFKHTKIRDVLPQAEAA
jgi:hypothetical protein